MSRVSDRLTIRKRKQLLNVDIPSAESAVSFHCRYFLDRSGRACAFRTFKLSHAWLLPSIHQAAWPSYHSRLRPLQCHNHPSDSSHSILITSTQQITRHKIEHKTRCATRIGTCWRFRSAIRPAHLYRNSRPNVPPYVTIRRELQHPTEVSISGHEKRRNALLTFCSRHYATFDLLHPFSAIRRAIPDLRAQLARSTKVRI